MISLIAAIGENREIGKDNDLLWDIPEEMKIFIAHTKDKTVLMGRKTFESIGSKPLPNRTNIVISRSMPETEGVLVYNDLDEALADYPDVMVMGGEQIYTKCLPKADELIISHIPISFPDADSFFPEFESDFDGKIIHNGSPLFVTYKYTKRQGENHGLQIQSEQS